MSVIYINLYNNVICIFKKLLTKAAFGCSVETSSHFSLSLSQKMPSQDTFHIPAMFLSVMLVFLYLISLLDRLRILDNIMCISPTI